MQTQPEAAPTVNPPDFGEPARSFTAACGDIPNYSFDVAAGRWLVLMMLGSLSSDASLEGLRLALARRALFNDADAALFAVTVDPADRDQRGLRNSEPGVRFFWDFDCAISRLYGVADEANYQPALFLIDPAFRVVMAEPIDQTEAVLDRLEQELAAARAAKDGPSAPVLTLPRVLEPQLCAQLIAYFRAGAPSASGFAANREGRTVEQYDAGLKRRSDVTITDPALVEAVRTRLQTRLFPMIKRAFGWQAAHIERYLICRYAGDERGFFSAHRDDVTAGSAHRKFAVTMNLNTEDYDGGDVRFPEFGPRLYRTPTGGATVFSCNLLHEATPVTRGERFALVPFLFDDEGERLRRANLALVDG